MPSVAQEDPIGNLEDLLSRLPLITGQRGEGVAPRAGGLGLLSHSTTAWYTDTQQRKRIYAKRLGMVEPVFANICVQKRMNRFTLRSKQKADVQWTRTRFTLVHNIGKIHTFGTLI